MILQLYLQSVPPKDNLAWKLCLLVNYENSRGFYEKFVVGDCRVVTGKVDNAAARSLFTMETHCLLFLSRVKEGISNNWLWRPIDHATYARNCVNVT